MICTEFEKYLIFHQSRIYDVSSIGFSYAFIGSQAKLTRSDVARTKYGRKFETAGQIIDVHLDLEDWKLSYCIDGQDYGVAFYVDESEYTLAVSMCKGTILEFVDR